MESRPAPNRNCCRATRVNQLIARYELSGSLAIIVSALELFAEHALAEGVPTIEHQHDIEFRHFTDGHLADASETHDGWQRR